MSGGWAVEAAQAHLGAMGRPLISVETEDAGRSGETVHRARGRVQEVADERLAAIPSRQSRATVSPSRRARSTKRRRNSIRRARNPCVHGGGRWGVHVGLIELVMARPLQRVRL